VEGAFFKLLLNLRFLGFLDFILGHLLFEQQQIVALKVGNQAR
jgi:hypothetical protein